MSYPGKVPDAASDLDRSVQAVLFACSHNAIRSPMASALLRWRSRNRLYVRSCGLEPVALDPFAVSVMDELGLDISRHRPSVFEDLEDASFDMVISLSPEAHHWAVDLTHDYDLEIEYWPTYDPSDAVGSRDQVMGEYRQARDHLDRRIRERFRYWLTY